MHKTKYDPKRTIKLVRKVSKLLDKLVYPEEEETCVKIVPHTFKLPLIEVDSYSITIVQDDTPIKVEDGNFIVHDKISPPHLEIVLNPPQQPYVLFMLQMQLMNFMAEDYVKINVFNKRTIQI